MVWVAVEASVLASADDMLLLVLRLMQSGRGLLRLGPAVVGRIVLVMLVCAIVGACAFAVWQCIKSRRDSCKGNNSLSGSGQCGTSVTGAPKAKSLHEDRAEEFIKEMTRFGVHPSAAVPPIYRLLWQVGIDVPPPVFQSPVEIVVFTGGPFGVLFGVGMYLMQWQPQGMSLVSAAVCAAIAGVLFGLAVAWYYRRMAQRYVLPLWSEYKPNTIAKRS